MMKFMFRTTNQIIISNGKLTKKAAIKTSLRATVVVPHTSTVSIMECCNTTACFCEC